MWGSLIASGRAVPDGVSKHYINSPSINDFPSLVPPIRIPVTGLFLTSEKPVKNATQRLIGIDMTVRSSHGCLALRRLFVQDSIGPSNRFQQSANPTVLFDGRYGR